MAWVIHDGIRMKVGGTLYKWWLKNGSAALAAQLKRERAALAAKRSRAKAEKIHQAKRAAVVKEALSLVGIREDPPGSNRGAAVRLIQSATGQYGVAWCVSTVQRIWVLAGLGTWAEKTAGAYFLEDYARQHGDTIPHPVAGCAVVYRIGEGHAGTVVAVNRNGTFWAVEGNWNNEVVHILRNAHEISCTFILRPELR